MDAKEKQKILDPHGCKPEDATCPHKVYDGKKMDPQAALTGAKGRTYCGAFFERDGTFRAVYDFEAKIHPAVKKVFDAEIESGIQGTNAPMTALEKVRAERLRVEADNAAAEARALEEAEVEKERAALEEARAKRPNRSVVAPPASPYGPR